MKYCLICQLRYISEGKIIIQGRNLIELGCGTGIVGILSSVLGASSVIMTDYHEKVVENAKFNAELNLCKHIEVQKVDWRDIEKAKNGL